MPRPAYPLKDDQGRAVLSRNRRFNHPWFSSKRVNPYFNESMDDANCPRPAVDPITKWPDGCFVLLGGAKQR